MELPDDILDKHNFQHIRTHCTKLKEEEKSAGRKVPKCYPRGVRPVHLCYNYIITCEENLLRNSVAASARTVISTQRIQTT